LQAPLLPSAQPKTARAGQPGKYMSKYSRSTIEMNGTGHPPVITFEMYSFIINCDSIDMRRILALRILSFSSRACHFYEIELPGFKENISSQAL